jgi:ADP-ribose pyrophosphatase YjhB (NUDIX family)
MKQSALCPHCGLEIPRFRNPFPTADIIIRREGRIALIRRRNPPLGWALPGGFIDYGESAERAALREAKEETGLDLEDLRQFGVYSAPDRDPRHHTLTVVFTARAVGMPRAADDALAIDFFSADNLPDPLAFDHAKILADYFSGNAPCAGADTPLDGHAERSKS